VTLVWVRENILYIATRPRSSGKIRVVACKTHKPRTVTIMKGISLSTGALAFGIASAFPHLMTSPDSPLVRDALAKRQAVNPDSGAPLPLLPPPFDAAQQHVSTTGQYAFVPPGSGDARGPCPGLNAMANHGYLPHNGIATIQQFVTGTYQVFGMAAVRLDASVDTRRVAELLSGSFYLPRHLWCSGRRQWHWMVY